MKLHLVSLYVLSIFTFMNLTRAQSNDCDTVAKIFGMDSYNLCCRERAAVCNNENRVIGLNL